MANAGDWACGFSQIEIWITSSKGIEMNTTKERQSNSHRRKLKIAIFGSRGIPHTYGGAEAFLGELAPRLAARGHEVLVYCRRSLFKERPHTYRGVHLIYLPSIETKVLGTPTHTLLCVLDMLYRGLDAALVVNIVNGFHCVLPRLLGKKIAINVDGMDWKRDKWGTLAKKYFYWNAQCVGKICGKGVVTDAYEMQRIYLEEFDTPSVCIAYGANIETSTNPEILGAYGLEPSRYYLIASRLVPENNADLIMDAFERVKTSRILAIAGGANYKSAFIDRLKQTKDPRVRFLGHVGNAEHVKELHCNAYAYLHGHSMGGTNPSLLKALGCGNCVVALRTPFNQEVMTDHGVFFERDTEELARKLQDLENQPDIVADYRRRAPARIREAYTWERITDQYEELFLQLAAGEDPTREHSTVRSLATSRDSHAAATHAAGEI
jgi:glycosyltransferase involved in cell wall biosynthesis